MNKNTIGCFFIITHFHQIAPKTNLEKINSWTEKERI